MTDAALRLDAYLEGLLTDRGRPAAPVDADGADLPADAGLDPWQLRAVELLAGGLVRFHPSFRFEEALAARLQAAAEAMRLPAVVGGSPQFGRLLTVPDLPGLEEAAPDAREGRPVRGLLVSGAIASGVSLAGAAYLAWRRGRREPSRET
ncbi:MAG: hypothetical protein ACXWN2_04230 [Candidatus Limnocylindrales bacterium]